MAAGEARGMCGGRGSGGTCTRSVCGPTDISEVGGGETSQEIVWCRACVRAQLMVR